MERWEKIWEGLLEGSGRPYISGKVKATGDQEKDLEALEDLTEVLTDVLQDDPSSDTLDEAMAVADDIFALVQSLRKMPDKGTPGEEL